MFRAETSNVMNHPSLLAPNSDLNSATFGTLGAARDLHNLQRSLKPLF